MRTPLLLTVAALVLTACGGGASTVAAPTSTTTSASASTAATTTVLLANLLPKWKTKLTELDPKPCDAAAAFSPECLRFMVKTSTVADGVVVDATQLGSKYAPVALEAKDISAAAEKWVSTCMTTEAGSSARSSCLPVLYKATLGGEAILAKIYAVESP